ncbi:DUF2141 domain-containing protein [[Pseudomonas] boreopolis]|uniref:DUF2141 domain-containing protein n=1 Tax=Xanthomonas boreopolis TaxID=86183 RepID=UPI003DA1B228
MGGKTGATHPEDAAMTTRLPLLALLALTACSAVHAADLGIDLHGVRTQAGQLHVALVDAAGWDGQGAPLRAAAVAPSGADAHVEFRDLPAGEYAVRVMHDENGNGKLDTNMLGMPLEGYGFSNDPKVMRKPTFDEARFALPATGTSIAITLR